jgi:ribosomal protein S6
MEHPRYYETMAIVPTTLEEAQVEAIIERARSVLESLGAKVHTARVWDKRKLAYEIKNTRRASTSCSATKDNQKRRKS